MIAALGLPQHARILEVGCGRGVALPVLEERLRPTRLVGIDIDPALLTIAGQQNQDLGAKVEVTLGDVRALPFPDADFDLVIDFGTCYHISRAGEALREIVRVLTPGGSFVTETRLSQLLSHPIRSRLRPLPWAAAPGLRRHRRALLWERRQRCVL
ncbi:MAG: class I SAM-dependent methyltransferase [Gemmatimonadales bacterium]